jgi:hypothetical protein
MFGDVILTRDVPERGLRAGDVGTVVERQVVPDGREKGHSVEFFDLTGTTVAIETLPASALGLPTPAERPADGALTRSAVPGPAIHSRTPWHSASITTHQPPPASGQQGSNGD